MHLYVWREEKNNSHPNLNICIVVPVFCSKTCIRSKKRARKTTLQGVSGLLENLPWQYIRKWPAWECKYSYKDWCLYQKSHYFLTKPQDVLAQKEYKRKHDNIARLVHWKLLCNYGLNRRKKCYEHQLDGVYRKMKDVRYCGTWPSSVTILLRPEDLTLLF